MTEERTVSAKSVAYPTMGLLLLGGITDKARRLPRHVTAGIAYTSPESDIFAETELYAVRGSKQAGTLDGKPIGTSTGSRSPIGLINKYAGSIFERFGLDPHKHTLSFDSRNHRILSGSSDAGAAAMGRCIEKLCGGIQDWQKFENELRSISESVGRSLYGGLTITPLDGNGVPHTEQLLAEKEFSGYTIVACNFKSAQRVSADSIHENIVSHTHYAKRIESATQRGFQLRKLAEKGEIEGIFDLAERDSAEWHGLLEEVGVIVRTPQMRSCMRRLDELRPRLWNRHLVVSGSNVFAFVANDNADELSAEAQRYGAKPIFLKVADRAQASDD